MGVVRLSGSLLTGFVVDTARRHVALAVELLIDGLPLGLARADLFDRELASTGTHDAHHGFAFTVPEALLGSAALAEVRLANQGDLVGTRGSPGRTGAEPGRDRARVGDMARRSPLRGLDRHPAYERCSPARHRR